MSYLALKGTEITRQMLQETTAQMQVKHTGEQAHLETVVESENIKVTYTVGRERKEISKGMTGTKNPKTIEQISPLSSLRLSKKSKMNCNILFRERQRQKRRYLNAVGRNLRTTLQEQKNTGAC